MEFEEFEQAVEKVLEDIPSKYKKVLEDEGIEVFCREYIPRGLKRRYPGGIVFGLFVGISKNKKSIFSISTEPTRIEIYQESFEKVFGPELNGRMKEQIFKTLVHEIAHYFGFNEEEVRIRGY